MGEGIFVQKCGLVAVDLVAACGVMTPEQLSGLARLIQEAEAFRVKMTSRQTMVVVLPSDKVPVLLTGLPALGLVVSPYGNVVRAVKGCAGNAALCPRAIANALDLAIELQEKYLGQEVPKDFKIAVAGCPRGCVDPHCADFGLLASGQDVYDVIVGGIGGSKNPRHGQVIARRVSAEKAQKLLDHILTRFRELAQPREKLGRTIQRVGLDQFLPPAELAESEPEQPAADFVQFLQQEEVK
ncbi:MAG: nitrite reductase [Desulfurispora sp.]|uniref:nitrite reductase n=1 Tax=Desulfurispora sp. TaxID=3014275 RepID=UPI00404B41C3